ncbi:MAG TPA: Wzz/FepE/Etk N-terminal domain-containing protein [Candidatus Sulfotelmatobacter sp.]|jgi:polysaccharide chain length determinant protein (PEP-CTERM system associated)
MIENREWTLDDYLAMLRRRATVILVPVILAPLAGFLLSFAFPAKYTSTSLILVEGQKVPESMVQPVVSEDLAARVATLQQQVLSQGHLLPVVEKVYPGRSSQQQNEIIDTIRANMAVEPVVTDLSAIGSTTKGGNKKTSPVPGFNLRFTASNAREAQQVCTELTTLLVDENRKQIDAAATGTSDVLNRGIEDAKGTLDGMDAKLAAFKKEHVGQLPGDEENNLKILAGLNSQLEANTQMLNRAQQDKAYTESVLAQQLTAWKSSQASTNPDALQKQLTDLQTQLLQLQAKYTDDHPDVIKTKADVASLKKKLAEVRASSDAADASGDDKASAMEPAEIRQLRLQVHQYAELIAAGNRDQKHLQQEIGEYQGRVSLSPAVEEQFKQLTRDYDNAQKNYEDLLGKKSSADLTVKMNTQAQGERMFVLNLASLPDSPSFPNRWLFAGGGLAAGLALGIGLALGMELQDNAIRTESDAEAVLQLPILAAVPWVSGEVKSDGVAKFKFWSRKKTSREYKQAVGA